jgi:tRNA (cytidine/uridine-2'-O-)-methyltransferase
MFDLILFQPEIPPNTGNIIRLCANTGTSLHLVHPLGFSLDERRLRRAGLDYREWARIQEHDSLDECLQVIRPRSLYALSTRGETLLSEARFEPGDAFVLGPETRGLPDDVLSSLDDKHVIRIPMRAGSRSLNLGNAAAVVVYEAWRQQGFDGGR